MTTQVFRNPVASAIATAPDPDAERLTVTGEHKLSRLAYAIFLGLAGSIAWSLLVAGSFVLRSTVFADGDVAPSTTHLPVTAGWSFLVLIGILVSMRLSAPKGPSAFDEEGARFEQGLAVAAAYCLGPSLGGWAMALALTVEALARVVERKLAGTSSLRMQLPWLSRSLVWSGISGGIVLGVTWAWGANRFFVPPPPLDLGDGSITSGHGPRITEFIEIVRIFGAGVTSMLVLGVLRVVEHNLVARTRAGLARSPKLVKVARRNRIQALIAGWISEATLFPLGVVMVLLFHAQPQAQRPMGFVLVVVGYLIVAGRFYRLWDMGTMLGRRMVELETLHRSARALAQTFEQPTLVETVLREAGAAISEANVLWLGLRDEEGTPVFDVYSPGQDKFERVTFEPEDEAEEPSVPNTVVSAEEALSEGHGVFQAIMGAGRSLLLSDLEGVYEPKLPKVEGVAPPRSWLGVPLARYDEVFGVLAVQSPNVGAFGPGHIGLLEALASQAAVALENARLYELATVDGLTGLYVRRYFDTRLTEEVMRSHRYQTPFAVLLLDLDDFKQVNDQYGHVAGDRVLREVAHVVRHRLRGIDIAARYGGEEFAVILPRIGLADAMAVAERIRTDVAQHRVEVGPGVFWQPTASLGVAVYTHETLSAQDEISGSQAVIATADLALYRAKAAGKNRVEGADKITRAT